MQFFSSVQFSRSVVSDSLWPHEMQFLAGNYVLEFSDFKKELMIYLAIIFIYL